MVKKLELRVKIGFFKIILLLLVILNGGCGPDHRIILIDQFENNAEMTLPELKSAVYISLKNEFNEKLDMSCTGVIFGQNLILTAAHCFEPIQNRAILPDEVFIGASLAGFSLTPGPVGAGVGVRRPADFSWVDVRPGEVRSRSVLSLKVEAFQIHPEYPSFYHDIAWIKVEKIPPEYYGFPVLKDPESLLEGTEMRAYGLAMKSPKMSLVKSTSPDSLSLMLRNWSVKNS